MLYCIYRVLDIYDSTEDLHMEVWVQFFKEGFFGYGEKGDFQYYSIEHFIPLILLAAGIFLFYRYRDALREWKHEENFRFIFAFIMLRPMLSQA